MEKQRATPFAGKEIDIGVQGQNVRGEQAQDRRKRSLLERTIQTKAVTVEKHP